jgi:hypothetical protein
MCDAPILESIIRLRATTDALREDMREVKSRLGILENQYASLSTWLDRINLRVSKIEERLGLVDA